MLKPSYPYQMTSPTTQAKYTPLQTLVRLPSPKSVSPRVKFSPSLQISFFSHFHPCDRLKSNSINSLCQGSSSPVEYLHFHSMHSNIPFRNTQDIPDILLTPICWVKPGATAPNPISYNVLNPSTYLPHFVYSQPLHPLHGHSRRRHL
jgi:hypothetical protein